MRPVWRGILALVLAAGGQLLLSKYLPTVGRMVDLYTVLVLYYAVTRRRVAVMVMGTTAGLVEDLLASPVLGVNAFKKTLVGYVMGTLGTYFMLNQPLPRFGVLFLATLLEALTEAGLFLVLGQHAVLPSTGDLVRLGMGNGVAGIIAYWLASKVE
ncbi:MAG TPA: rod shape-determining protein MreD, partial [Candidatus Polarisedimenticolia bacterium]|jgi:rod shape-determining protein MreD|nr:rod shape-determining protein MreD [Candidatus Polarisedimenticolia bacterium]